MSSNPHTPHEEKNEYQLYYYLLEHRLTEQVLHTNNQHLDQMIVRILYVL